MTIWLLAATATAQEPTELGLVWMLTVAEQPAGTREVSVRYEGQTGERVRIFEAYTEIDAPPEGKRRKKNAEPEVLFRQRLTANSQEGAPASFHSTLESRGQPKEIQARYSLGAWRLSITDGAGTRSSTINPSSIDLSTVDLFDPESERSLAGLDHARILDAGSGEVISGDVIALGPSELEVGGEMMWVDGWEWRTEQFTWRLFYALNGFVVRFQGRIGGQEVDAKLIGAAPRAIDEFGIPPQPEIEQIDL